MSKSKSSFKTEKSAKKILIALVSAFIAIALGLTCALCFGGNARLSNADKVEAGGVRTSATTYSNLEGNKSGAGALVVGDVINYTYVNNKVYSITLPAGSYQFEVWGAQGGGGYRDGTFLAGTGLGGYAKGTATISTARTFYIVVGGQGANGVKGKYGSSSYALGGYNGGGNSGNEMNSDANDEGGGGGGATHIALVTGVLKNLSSAANKNNVVIVAGGGGGTSYTRAAGMGHGGGTTGGAGYGGGIAGGGTQTAGGVAGTTSEKTYANPNGTAGGFGYGGNGGNGTSGGGGGGGGWYGGGGAGVGNNGGGGSGYTGGVSGVTPVVPLTGAGMSTGVRTGNGYATIKVLNLPPVAKSTVPSAGSGARGTVNISVAASSLATDAETVYFTQGAANLDTQPTTNGYLYLDAACSKPATSYLSWSWTNSTACTTLTITEIKLYPRNGIDGCTSNGRLTLYAKVRDNYGTAGTMRSMAVVPFYLYVTEPAPTLKGSTTSSVGINSNTAYIGTTSTSNNSASGNLYNPNGNNLYTVTVKNPLKKGATYTIKAADLLSNVKTTDMVVIALNSVSNITGSARKYSIVEYDATNSPNKKTIYNTSKSLVANTFDQITIKCENPDTTYQVLPVTLYVVEMTTAYGTATPNVVPGIATVAMNVVFKVDNTRPVLKDTSTTAPVVNLTALSSTSVNLNTYFTDVDTSSISATTHTIKNVIVPTYEYVQVDKYGNVVSTANKSGTNINKSYFNVVNSNGTSELSNALNYGTSLAETTFKSWYISNSASNTAFVQYSFSGTTLTLTGLRATYNMYSSTRGTKSFVTAGKSGSTLTTSSEGVLNAGHFYILINIQDKSDTADGGIWLPLGITVGNAAPTEISHERGATTGSSSMPTANGAAGDPNDEFFFTPMGITINRVTGAIGKYYNKGSYTSTNLTPLSSDSDNYFTSNMLRGAVAGDSTAGYLNELVTIASTASEVLGSVSYTDSITSTVKNGSEYFDATLIDIYIPESYFGGRILASSFGATQSVDYNNNGGSVSCVVIKGLKIKLKNWTNNRFLYATVKVADTVGRANNTSVNVNLAIKVSNITPQTLDGSAVATLNYTDKGKTVSSTYEVENNVATITYNMPMHSTAIITPYDLLTDANMTASGVAYPAGGFTLNGLNGMYDSATGKFSVDDAKKNNDDKRTSIAALAIKAPYAGSTGTYATALKSTLKALQSAHTFKNSTSTSNLYGAAKDTSKVTYIDRLYFERSNDTSNLDGYTFNPYASNANGFAAPSVIGTSFIDYNFGSSVAFKNSSGNYDVANTYNIDYIIVTANNRTQAGAPAEITLKVRDRMGAGTSGGVKTVKIIINVVNSTPYVQYPDTVYTLSVDSVTDNGKVIPDTLIINAVTSATDTSKNFIVDNEGDAVSFYTGNSPSYILSGEDAGGNKIEEDFGKYLRVTITSDTITITALNSTQSINKLYLEFYATDGRPDNDGNTAYTTCKIQIEVLNSMPKINNDSNGFTKTSDGLNMWAVESLNNIDITKTRYFASSENAEKLLMSEEGEGASSNQIKRIANDSDSLQGLVLSPVKNPGESTDSERKYYNANPTGTGSDKITYAQAVPYATTNNGKIANGGVGVYIDIRQPSNGSTLISKYLKADSYDIIYFVNNTAYTATDLRAKDETWWNNNHGNFFDSEGRWKVTDWAVYVTPLTYSAANEYIQLNIMVRDEAKYGGSTAGKSTAYKANTATSVDGYKYMTYQLFITSLGIVPYTYYNQFDGYYVVADGKNADVHYVSTYDGDTQSIYFDDNWKPIYVDGKNINSTTGTNLKSRANETADETEAGIHSGAEYPMEQYSFDVKRSDGAIKKNAENAFKYSDTIKISSDKTQFTYIPMSYFALGKSLVKSVEADGKVVYYDDEYVAYDIAGVYDRKNDYYKAITISDGTTSWGRGSSNTLDANPYVKFDNFDACVYDAEGHGSLISDTNNADYKKYSSAVNGEYFNHCLAVTTVDGSGNALGYLTTTATDTRNANAKNLVGNGHLMYLAGQESKLQENLFGIGIAKKNTRASTSTLTITIAVAQCRFNGSTITTYDTNNPTSGTAKVTFKLDIGNSPVTLNESDVSIDADDRYYYTNLELTTGDTASTIALSRNNVAGVTKTIRFNDDDQITENGVVNVDKSDKAYFYADSMRKLSSWSLKSDAYNRVMENTTSGGKLTFNNTDESETAQSSMRNYFGTRDKNNGYAFTLATPASIENTDNSFMANGGKYSSGANEGYSGYFSAAVSSDGTRLSITPLAKTTINSQMLSSADDIEEYYNKCGLEYDGSKGYYPFKVLIYDSHGDGFMAGSYVSLEIRVYIKTSAPTLSPSLEDDEKGAKGDKKIDVSLPVESNYNFNISDVIKSNDLLTGSNGVLWVKSRDKWDEDADYSNLSEFKKETGTFLVSPFSDANYKWSAPSNENLRNGSAKLSDYKLSTESQNDVIMYLDYEGETLGKSSAPKGDLLVVSVNRRSTYDGKQYKNFSFKILFTDSEGNTTNWLTVNVEVTNQAPTVRQNSVNAAKGFTMRVGDYFTVVTTPYNYFTGEYNGSQASMQASTTYKNAADSRVNAFNNRNLFTDNVNNNKFKALTSTVLDSAYSDSNPYPLHSYNKAIVGVQNLGYLAAAIDDSPWELRVLDLGYKEDLFEITSWDKTFPEGKTGGDELGLDVIIVASKVCTNEPISIIVADGDGAQATLTIYVTVESSKPSAISENDKQHERSDALISTYRDENGQKQEVSGVFETYMVSSAVTTSKLTNVKVYNKNLEVIAEESNEVIDNGIRTIANVYGELELKVNQIAYDPDSTDNNNIALYTGTDNDYNIFTLNDASIKKGDTYANEMYKITIAKDYKSFKITCLTYNPYSDWDELKFYIRDVGNNIFENAIPITIKICTLYSAITNEYQSNTQAVTGNPLAIGARFVNTVNVKPYDDFIGASVGMTEAEKAEKVGVKSTYQFLEYKGMAASVDQKDGLAGINDADVLNSSFNLNYSVNIYAFMNEDSNHNYSSMTVADASKYFAFDRVQYPNNISNHYMYLKSDTDVNTKYLVGGIYSSGAALPDNRINKQLSMFIKQYFEFEVGEDGVSLALSPVTANINFNILFYVEITKVVDDSTRDISPYNTVITGGTLFYVKVEDSAPVANTQRSVLEFTGKKGDSVIFPIFDEANPYLSLFTDTDMGDIVEVKEFASASTAADDYAKALINTKYDWQSRTGVPRAIDIKVNNTDKDTDAEHPENNIPAHSLKITIQRRIDVVDEDGNYAEKVKLPVLITGWDRESKWATVELNITIQNSDFDISSEMLGLKSQHYNSLGVGYSVRAVEGEKKTYLIDTYAAPDSGAISIGLVADGWLSDPDFSDMKLDTDSYRLMRPFDSENDGKYMVDDAINVYADDGDTVVAELKPLYGKDKLHFIGFEIAAKSYKRNITGEAYMRLLDRSGANEEGAGITLVVHLTVLNAAPTLVSGTQKSFVVVGSDTKSLSNISIDISKYAKDENGDPLYIYSYAPDFAENIHSTSTIDGGGNLVTVSVDENNDQICVISPRKGFYGSQKVLIMIADGDDSARRTVTLELNVTVVYDFGQVTTLKTIEAYRSLPKKITAEILFPEIDDTYEDLLEADDLMSSNKVRAASNGKTFNPGNDYVVIGLVPNAAGVTVSKDAENDYQFVCEREMSELTFNVTFARKIDYDFINEKVVDGADTFTKQFTATVGKNTAPELLENFKRDSGYTFYSRGGDYGLDNNGTVALTTSMLFRDEDIEKGRGDRLLFDAKVTSVESPSMCSVRVSEDGTILYLTFNVRGETKLTVGVKDRTGETVKSTFTIKNIDRPEPSFMTKIKISYETYPWIWIGVGIGILLLLLLIILLIILLKRRKRKREELEAILVSEMELEEQMLRIAGGVNGPAPYQSYGYLPPTMPVQNDPGLMLGAGGAAPTSNAIGLNAGQSSMTDGDSGVSGDSDM